MPGVEAYLTEQIAAGVFREDDAQISAARKLDMLTKP